MTSIAEQAATVKAASSERLPADVLAAFAAEQGQLVAGGIPATAVAVGDELAPFTLPDATGQDRTLDELTSEGPAVIVFYRGGWCPYCNIALRAYEQELLPQLDAFSARLVAVSPETPDASLSTQDRDELTYAVLSDTGATLADSLGLTFNAAEASLAAQHELGLDIRATRADDGTRLPMPTVLIVDSGHVVRFVDIHPDYTSRTEVDTIVGALAALATP